MKTNDELSAELEYLSVEVRKLREKVKLLLDLANLNY